MLTKSSPRSVGLKLILTTLLAAASLALSLAHAEMKVGQDPTTLAPGALLQTQSDDGSNVVTRKTTTQVGINTANPQNRLEVTSGTAGNSGVRLTNLPNASLLATNANGDVVSASSASVCTCGEIKQAAVASLGANWYKMDGVTSAPANSCGVSGTLPNAAGALLVQGGTLGQRTAAANLAQNQLPNATLSGTTASEGGHRHAIRAIAGTGTQLTHGPPSQYNQPSNNPGYAFLTNYTQNDGAHTHAFTTSSINGNVAQQTLTTGNLPVIGVNTFVCLHN